MSKREQNLLLKLILLMSGFKKVSNSAVKVLSVTCLPISYAHSFGSWIPKIFTLQQQVRSCFGIYHFWLLLSSEYVYKISWIEHYDRFLEEIFKPSRNTFVKLLKKFLKTNHLRDIRKYLWPFKNEWEPKKDRVGKNTHLTRTIQHLKPNV